MSFDFPFVRLLGVRKYCFYPYCLYVEASRRSFSMSSLYLSVSKTTIPDPLSLSRMFILLSSSKSFIALFSCLVIIILKSRFKFLITSFLTSWMYWSNHRFLPSFGIQDDFFVVLLIYSLLMSGESESFRLLVIL